MIVIKRAYDAYDPADGYRVLIDRLWPRGVSKADAHLDEWAKDIAPSRALREWYGHDPDKWPEFKKRYEKELGSPAAKAILDDLARRARRSRVTLVYASRAAEISDVVVVERLLDRRLKAHRKPRARASSPEDRRTPGAAP